MRMTMHIPNRIAREAKKFAGKDGISLSAFVAQALEFYIDRRRKMKVGEKILKLTGTVQICEDTYDQAEGGRIDRRP